MTKPANRECAPRRAPSEDSDIETRANILSRQRKTKGLIRLRGCAGLSAALVFAYGKIRFSHDAAYYYSEAILT